MVFTEIKEIDGKKYYYRIKSVRKGDKITRQRIYLGTNLHGNELSRKEKQADEKLLALNYLLNEEELKFLEKLKEEYKKEPLGNLENRYEVFCARFTYDSAAIEGNTLSLEETASLLFENIVPSHKSMREINETLNHKKAFDFLLTYKGDIDKKLITKLHEFVVKDTLKPHLADQIGTYRKLQVYIKGTDWMPPKPEEVTKEMKDLLSWYTRNKKTLNPIVLAAYFHVAFETVHPFVDGNGRTGRLLMNFILRKNNFPMINIPSRIKSKYYAALKEGQLKGNLRPFVELLISIFKEENLRF
jgi:Fic family protein